MQLENPIVGAMLELMGESVPLFVTSNLQNKVVYMTMLPMLSLGLPCATNASSICALPQCTHLRFGEQGGVLGKAPASRHLKGLVCRSRCGSLCAQEEYVLEHMAEVFSCLRCANVSLRWLLLHTGAAHRKLRAAVAGAAPPPGDLLTLLLDTALLEFEVGCTHMGVLALFQPVKCKRKPAPCVQGCLQFLAFERVVTQDSGCAHHRTMQSERPCNCWQSCLGGSDLPQRQLMWRLWWQEECRALPLRSSTANACSTRSTSVRRISNGLLCQPANDHVSADPSPEDARAISVVVS